MAKFISRNFIEQLKEELGLTRVSSRTGNSFSTRAGNSNTSRPMTDNSRDNQRSDGEGGSRDTSDYGLFGNKDYSLLSGLGSLFGNLGLKDVFTELTSYLHTLTRGQLTGAEREQNVFNAEQAAIQRGFEERMSSTAYQRAVQDMKDAHLNPALMYGSGSAASTPSGSAASGSASAGSPAAVFDLILGLQNMKMQDKISQRQSVTNIRTAQIAADAAVESSKYGADKGFEGKHEENVIREKELQQRIEEAKSKCKLEEEQAKSEGEKRKLYAMQAILEHANAERINAILPFEKAKMQAETAEARWHAELDMVEAGLKNSLVSNGLVHYMMEQYRITGSIDNIKKDILEITRKRYKVTDTPLHHAIHGISSIISDVTSSYLVDPSSLLKVPIK